MLAAAVLALVRDYRLSARLNVAAGFIAFACALLLLWHRPRMGPLLLVDDLNVVFIVLSTLVGFTTSVFSASYIGHELATGRLTPGYLRFYHAMFQLMMLGMNLALTANNIGLMWVAVELATLTTVMMVGIYRTHAAIEAAWKYFILGSVGIALALFGTILVYLAARPVVGEGIDAMAWTVPFAHVVIIVCALGLAGPAGNFAGLLQLTMQSVTRSAIFFSVGQLAQVKGAPRSAAMGGLTESQPVLGWALVAGVAAIAGLPLF